MIQDLTQVSGFFTSKGGVELYRWDLGSFYPRRHPWVDLWVFGTCRVLGLRFLDFKLTLRFLDWSCDLFLLYVCLTQFLDTWVDEEKKPEGFFRRLDVWLKSDSQEWLAQWWKRACAKGLFAGKTGLVGFWCLGTLEELVFIWLEGFLLSFGFRDSKRS